MKPIYVLPTIVAAIIIGLAVSAAFAIGPTPFMDGTFTGYPSNNRRQGQSLSSGEPALSETYAYLRQEGNIVSLTYATVVETCGSLADTETGMLQGFEFSVSIGFSGFPSSYACTGPMDHVQKARVDAFPFSGVFGEAFSGSLRKSPASCISRIGCEGVAGTVFVGWACLFGIWCLAGFGLVGLVFCGCFASEAILCVEDFRCGVRASETGRPFFPFFSILS